MGGERLSSFLTLSWYFIYINFWSPQVALVGKESVCQCRRCKSRRFDPVVWKIPWRWEWLPTSVILTGESHGWRSLVGCSPWGPKESDATERLHFQFSRSCIGERNGNPLQCSCLENPRDGGAWWAAVYGVAQSRTGLMRLSSSSSRSSSCKYTRVASSGHEDELQLL